MNSTLETLSPVEARLKVQVPASFVNERMNHYFSALAKSAKVPGFRAGKASQEVLQRLYGQEALTDLSERLISEFSLHALKEHKLELTLSPRLLATDLPKKDNDFHFELELDLKPTLPQIDLTSLKMEDEPHPQVTEDEIHVELNYLREAEATFKDCEPERPVQKEDCVVISYTGVVDHQPHPKLSAASETMILGKGHILPEFETALLEMKKNEKKNFEITFPEHYHEKSLAKKTAHFEVTVLQIKEKNCPPLDDVFAKLLDEKLNSLEELKEQIKLGLKEKKEFQHQRTVQNKIGAALVAQYPLTLSQRHIQFVAKELVEETHHRMHKMGMAHEESEEHLKLIYEKSLQKAERDVCLTYLLEAIAEQNQIEVNQEDIQKRLERSAKQTRISISEVKAYYSAKDEETGASRMENLKGDIRDEKSLDYALSKATIKRRG